MLSIYKAAYQGLLGWGQKELDDAYENLATDEFMAVMPNYEGWTTLEVELEDANYVGERDETIERLVELKMLDEDEKHQLYTDEGIKQIIFAI